MARKKSIFQSLFSTGRKTSMSRRFADAMIVRRSTRPTKLRNSKSRAGLFH